MRLQSIATAFIAFAFTAFVWAAPATYGDLAKQRVDQAWKAAMAEMKVLDADVKPEETKNLRKLIVALREQVDLFVYAYPDNLWMKIRDDLDEGYETIGSFKDLYDTQDLDEGEEARYSEADVTKKRNKVLAWKKDWATKEPAYKQYLNSPSTTKLFKRNKKDLSRFYWGASNLEPRLSLTGAQNLAALCKDLLELANKDWKSVKLIKNPVTNHDLQEKFHDFRKRLRSVARVIRTSSGVYVGSDQNLVTIEGLVDRYGDIEDKIVAHIKAVEKNKKKKAEKLEKEIGALWDQLLADQNNLGIKAVIESVGAGLVL